MTAEEKAKLTAELCETVAMLVWLEPGDITPTTSLTEVAVDSLGRVELIAHVEAHLGAMLGEGEMPVLDSIAEIVEYAEKMESELREKGAL